MKSPHNIIFSFLICILISVALTSCSPSASSLVGTWESSKPQFAHLSIELGASANDGYRNGFRYVREGRTVTEFWLVRNESRGTVLWLSPGGGMTGFAAGSMQISARPYKIIELKSDTLVIEWDNGRTMPFDRYEFHKVK